MEPHDYTVIKYDGEYVTLKDENGGELYIAAVLLPPFIDIGTRLHYENLEYTVIE